MFIENAIYISPHDDCYVTVMKKRNDNMVKVMGIVQGKPLEFIRKIPVKNFYKEYTMLPRCDAHKLLKELHCPVFRTAATKAYDCWCETPDLGSEDFSENYGIIREGAPVEFKLVYKHPETGLVIFRGIGEGTYLNGAFQAEHIPTMRGMQTITRVTHWRYRGLSFPNWTPEHDALCETLAEDSDATR